MIRKTRLLRLSATTLAALALTAAGCQRKPPEETHIEAPPGYDAYAPDVDMLPAGDPAPIGDLGPGEDYSWAEDAYGLNYAFEDMRPDYAYGYEDTELWGWESDDGWYRVVEPLSNGDRYYYYRPGEERPFYVMDGGYGYGFSDGVLLAVYDPSGGLMSRDYVRDHADDAGRYLRRGRDLRAARQAARRWQVAETRWASRQARLAAEQTRLERAAEVQAPWLAYRLRIRAEPATFRGFETERSRRQQARAPRRDGRREGRRDDAFLTPDSAPPPVTVQPPRRDSNPGVSKRSPKADAAHARNAERKAAHEEAKRAKREEQARRKAERD